VQIEGLAIKPSGDWGLESLILGVRDPSNCADVMGRSDRRGRRIVAVAVPAGCAGGVDEMIETGAQLVAGGVVEDEAAANATAEGLQLGGAEALGKASIASEDHAVGLGGLLPLDAAPGDSELELRLDLGGAAGADARDVQAICACALCALGATGRHGGGCAPKPIGEVAVVL
jgi:hypothetical protein